MDGRGEVTATDDPAIVRQFAQHRALLVGVAYRMLGSVDDAEDTVQDAWLRWSSARAAEVADPRAFLVTVTTRLAIDRLRRARTRRESYPGPWLPEPLVTAPDVAEDVERAESVSLALLVVLETLSPLERAVFVLREAFGHSHAEVAAILGRDEAAVRQLARRARAHVAERRPRFAPEPAMCARVTERFLAACLGGDLPALLGVLAPEVTLVADSGGKALAPPRPILGADRVARFLAALAVPPRAERFFASVGIAPGSDFRIDLVQVNGGPAIVVVAGGTPVTAILLDVTDDAVQTIYLLANPEKLAGLRAAPGADIAGPATIVRPEERDREEVTR